MANREFIQRLIDLLNTVQEWSGNRVIDIDGHTKPIGELPGFDSLNGVEVTVMICEEFKVNFPRANIFVNDAGTRAQTVTQVARYVADHVGQ